MLVKLVRAVERLSQPKNTCDSNACRPQLPPISPILPILPILPIPLSDQANNFPLTPEPRRCGLHR